MAPGATTDRRPVRLVGGLVAGTAACLMSVGGFHLWQAAAADHRATAGQARAAAAWAGADPSLPQAAIARLTSAERGMDLYVLGQADWDSLKDGPGLFAGVAPGAPGQSVIAGHRETHFAGLGEIASGDRIVVENRDGRTTTFRVTETRVVDGRTVRVGGTPDADAEPTLMLVTCYPFDSAERGPERFVVTAVAEG